MSGDFSTYWMESSLEISPIEQVELLTKLQNNSFGFAPENINAVKEASGDLNIAKTILSVCENDILIYEQYTQSNTIPKALEMGDFWTYSELAFSKIWEGEDVKTELTNLQELIRQRLN